MTYPAPEGTFNSLLLWMGQISGIVFIFGMDALKAAERGAMTVSLALLLATWLRESALIRGEASR